MIKGFAVHNFRSFRDSGRISLDPLTCLVGRNSSGKSSILHALMLLRQSNEYPALGARVPQLNLNGPLIEAGDYKDVISGHNPELPLGFVFYLSLPAPTRAQHEESQTSLVELDIPRPYERERLMYGWRYRHFHLRGELPTSARDVIIELQFLPQPPFGPTLSRLVVDVPNVGKATFVRTSAGQRVQHWRSYFEGMPPKSLDLVFPRASFFPFLNIRRTRLAGKIGLNLRRFANITHLGLGEINEFLTESKMVGPFRTPPARRYSFTGFGAVDTGVTGQRAVDLLITERLLGQPGEHLRTALSFWLKRLGLAKSIDVKNLARRSNIFEVLISGAGGVPTANFADVGFGISQVLPVLVQGFLVRRGGTFVVQQPELHLHPDAQAGLADFFLYLASQGINSIVETHSEYFLLRLRRRLAERTKPYLIGLPLELSERSRPPSRKDVSILHVSQTSTGGKLKSISIDKAFQFQDMPKGFMDQAIEDRLALVKALRKHA
jgi:hypothetical protein